MLKSNQATAPRVWLTTAATERLKEVSAMTHGPYMKKLNADNFTKFLKSPEMKNVLDVKVLLPDAGGIQWHRGFEVGVKGVPGSAYGFWYSDNYETWEHYLPSASWKWFWTEPELKPKNKKPMDGYAAETFVRRMIKRAGNTATARLSEVRASGEATARKIMAEAKKLLGNKYPRVVFKWSPSGNDLSVCFRIDMDDVPESLSQDLVALARDGVIVEPCQDASGGDLRQIS